MRKALFSIVAGVDLRDATALSGLALLGYGLHCVYPPACWMVVGAILIWVSVR